MRIRPSMFNIQQSLNRRMFVLKQACLHETPCRLLIMISYQTFSNFFEFPIKFFNLQWIIAKNSDGKCDGLYRRLIVLKKNRRFHISNAYSGWGDHEYGWIYKYLAVSGRSSRRMSIFEPIVRRLKNDIFLWDHL